MHRELVANGNLDRALTFLAFSENNLISDSFRAYRD